MHKDNQNERNQQFKNVKIVVGNLLTLKKTTEQFLAQQTKITDQAIDILKANPSSRSIIEITKLMSYFKQLPYFSKIAKKTNDSTINQIIEKFTKKINYLYFRKGSIVYQVGDQELYFNLILSGEASILVPKPQEQIDKERNIFLNRRQSINKGELNSATLRLLRQKTKTIINLNKQICSNINIDQNLQDSNQISISPSRIQLQRQNSKASPIIQAQQSYRNSISPSKISPYKRGNSQGFKIQPIRSQSPTKLSSQQSQQSQQKRRTALIVNNQQQQFLFYQTENNYNYEYNNMEHPNNVSIASSLSEGSSSSSQSKSSSSQSETSSQRKIQLKNQIIQIQEQQEEFENNCNLDSESNEQKKSQDSNEQQQRKFFQRGEQISSQNSIISPQKCTNRRSPIKQQDLIQFQLKQQSSASPKINNNGNSEIIEEDNQKKKLRDEYNSQFLLCFKGLLYDDICNPSQFFNGQVMTYYHGRYINVGESFGEHEIIKKRNREQTVIALEDLHLAYLNRHDYRDIIRDIDEIKIQQRLTLICSSLPSEIQQYSKNFSFLISLMKKMRFNQNQIIYEQDKTVRGCYIIKKGEVQIQRIITLEPPEEFININQYKYQPKMSTTIILSTLGQGQFLGEDEIVKKEKKRLFTAKSKSEIILYFIPKQYFKILLQENHNIWNIFLQRVKVKMEWQDKKLQEFANIMQSEYKMKFIQEQKQNEKIRQSTILSNSIFNNKTNSYNNELVNSEIKQQDNKMEIIKTQQSICEHQQMQNQQGQIQYNSACRSNSCTNFDEKELIDFTQQNAITEQQQLQNKGIFQLKNQPKSLKQQIFRDSFQQMNFIDQYKFRQSINISRLTELFQNKEIQLRNKMQPNIIQQQFSKQEQQQQQSENKPLILHFNQANAIDQYYKRNQKKAKKKQNQVLYNNAFHYNNKCFHRKYGEYKLNIIEQRIQEDPALKAKVQNYQRNFIKKISSPDLSKSMNKEGGSVAFINLFQKVRDNLINDVNNQMRFQYECLGYNGSEINDMLNNIVVDNNAKQDDKTKQHSPLKSRSKSPMINKNKLTCNNSNKPQHFVKNSSANSYPIQVKPYILNPKSPEKSQKTTEAIDNRRSSETTLMMMRTANFFSEQSFNHARLSSAPSLNYENQKSYLANKHITANNNSHINSNSQSRSNLRNSICQTEKDLELFPSGNVLYTDLLTEIDNIDEINIQKQRISKTNLTERSKSAINLNNKKAQQSIIIVNHMGKPQRYIVSE